jgi:hypothetical protein
LEKKRLLLNCCCHHLPGLSEEWIGMPGSGQL